MIRRFESLNHSITKSFNHLIILIYNKKSHDLSWLLPKFGIDLLSHLAAVPSALTGLTSLFGMGRGGSPSL